MCLLLGDLALENLLESISQAENFQCDATRLFQVLNPKTLNPKTLNPKTQTLRP